MATTANVFQTEARPFAPALRSLFAQFSASLARAQHRARVVRELSHHTDRQLADMGIARSDIRAIARGGIRR